MLSLLIALILLYGLNRVFTDTTTAIRAGQALSEATRNSRAVQPILFNDLTNCAPDSPVFIISSEVVPQYLNATDAASQQNLPASGCELGDRLHRTDMLMFFARGLYHRKTANGPTVNNTNTNNPTYPNFLVSTNTSNEAFIHYGHLRVSADGITPIGPDDLAGKAEPYASDWVLGRNVILMEDPGVNGAVTGLANAKDLGGNPETYYQRVNITGSPVPALYALQAQNLNFFGGIATNAGNLSPLSLYSPDTTVGTLVAPAKAPGTPVSSQVIKSGRYDVAGATIDQFRGYVNAAVTAVNAISNPPGTTAVAITNPLTSASSNYYFYWWSSLLYTQPHNAMPDTMNDPLPFSATPNVAAVNGGSIYGLSLNTVNTGPSTGPYPYIPYFPRYRFEASNILSPTPMTSVDQAHLSPYFMEHVSQFIVEYAGDFVTQDNSPAVDPTNVAKPISKTSGNILDTVPDGQIDWVYATKGYWSKTTVYSPGDYVMDTNTQGQYDQAVTPTLAVAPTAGPWLMKVTPPKQIRWYGMPRDSTGSGQVWSAYNKSDPFNGGKAPPAANALNNVVPLSDIWQLSASNANRPLPYEMETGPTLVDALNISPTPAPTSLVDATKKVAAVVDYADMSTSPTSVKGTIYVNNTLTQVNYAPANGMSPQARYTAVWRNDTPAMIRILIKVDDPTNALQDGPWSEYVFKLK